MLNAKSMEEIKEEVKKNLPSFDTNVLDIKIYKTSAIIVFIKDLVDQKTIGDLIVKPATAQKKQVSGKELKEIFYSPEIKEIESLEDVYSEVASGSTVLICEGEEVALSFGIKKKEKRAIAEPPTSTVIKGPREGFIEDIDVNCGLLRRRIKSSHLRFDLVTVGRYSLTSVAVCYIDGIADENLVRKIKERLAEIDIDATLDSSYISKFLGRHKFSLFKRLGNTEKPDILASKILEGRVAILVDGSPIALTVPYLLMEDFQSPSDYYSSSYSATFSRFIRFISVSVSILLPAIYVASELFHLQLIPLPFLLTIVNSIKGIPLSPSYEMFFTLLIFEILNEASVRMPRYVGMVVSIVGGLVLGETAVTAGIISAPTLMIVAFSGVCLFTVPELEQTFSLIRLMLLVVAGSLGVYGLIASIMMLTVYLITFENFSVPIFAPFSPLIKEDLKDGFIKGFTLRNESRPKSIKNANAKRIEVE